MNLKDLLNGTNVLNYYNEGLEITGVAYDSRKVQPGNVFVCIKGYASDGHKYIAGAAEKGAVCAIVQKGCEYATDIIPVVECEDTRAALGNVSAQFFGKPSDKLKIFGITGTNGKTTTTYMLSSILEKAGMNCGIIGTISYKVGNKVIESVNTTPESYEVQKMFADMVDAGDKACAMEVSSHALSMGRVDNVGFDYAIFSNLTEDHLDFHKDFEDYYQAKKQLFYKAWGAGLINIDDEYGERMFNELKEEGIRVYSYSAADPEADYYAEVSYKTDTHTVVKIYHQGSYVAGMRINIPGAFSVYNALSAFSAAYESGIDPMAIAEGIEGIPGVPGRFELVKNDKDVIAIVDYAHTPDALIKVLDTANEFKKGRLICVFGCGGDRDRTKRPLMGIAAGERSEFCIVTSDNPRTEDPAKILLDIEEGISKTGCEYVMIQDRKSAIEKAIEIYEPGDVIIIAGKGHEDYQIIGKEKIHFDDREVVSEILSR